MADTLWSIALFVIGMVISTVIIFIVTKLFGEKEGIKHAFAAALLGSAVYSIVYFIFGHGLLAAVAGGFVWLLALRALYSFGWIRAFIIALIIWIISGLIGLIIPTGPGPL
ncbi:MAG: hypothetical protein ACRD4W_02470 [Nitrososphaeraceae archaeon]